MNISIASTDGDISDIEKVLNQFGSNKINTHLNKLSSKKNSNEKGLKKIEKALFDADAFIIKAISEDNSISLIAGLAIAYKKPILMIVNKKVYKNNKVFLDAFQQMKRVQIVEGQSSSLELVISDFLNAADSMVSAKFFINLSPEINRYLEWWSDKYRKPKVDRLRELINDDISKNDDWKEVIN